MCSGQSVLNRIHFNHVCALFSLSALASLTVLLSCVVISLALTQQEDTDNNKTDGEGEKDEDDDGWEGEKPVVLAPMPAELVYTRQQVLSTTLDR